MSDQNETLLKEIFKAIPVRHKLQFLRETLASLEPELRQQLFQSLHEVRRTQRPSQPKPPPVRRRADGRKPLNRPPDSIRSQARVEPNTNPASGNPRQAKRSVQQNTPATPPKPPRVEKRQETHLSKSSVVTTQAELNQLATESKTEKDKKIEAVLKQFEQEKIIMLANDQTSIKKELFFLILWLIAGIAVLVGLAVGTRTLWEMINPS
ncbi:hypothetical protein APED_26765 [Acanthopleuribacter pedis]